MDPAMDFSSALEELPDHVKIDRFTLRHSIFDNCLAKSVRQRSYSIPEVPVRDNIPSNAFSKRLSGLPTELLRIVLYDLDILSLHQLAAVDTSIRGIVLSGMFSQCFAL